MSDCTSIDPLVTPYVDGELSAAERVRVDEHLRRCPPCHGHVTAEAIVRDLVQARKSGLTAECAPASLRSRCSTASAFTEVSAARRAPWRIGLAPLALAASLVVLVGGAFLYQATHYSARLLAAELAVDHVKCFTANRLLGTHDEPAVVESSMLSAFGWRLRLPEQFSTSGLELVGSRTCLYGEGKLAHLMYRDQGRPVSIFMLPKRSRPEELVEALGHEAAIWSSGDRTFVLVMRGSRAEVQRMAAFVKAALQ